MSSRSPWSILRVLGQSGISLYIHTYILYTHTYIHITYIHTGKERDPDSSRTSSVCHVRAEIGPEQGVGVEREQPRLEGHPPTGVLCDSG